MYVEDSIDSVIWSIDKYDQLPNLMNVGLGHDYSIANNIEFTDIIWDEKVENLLMN